MTTTTKKAQGVLVTTLHRGVFFGYSHDTTKDSITLTDARMCLYWSADMSGFMGLAAYGPSKECRISAQVSSIEIRNITSVTVVDAKACKRWKDAPCVS